VKLIVNLQPSSYFCPLFTRLHLEKWYNLCENSCLFYAYAIVIYTVSIIVTPIGLVAWR